MIIPITKITDTAILPKRGSKYAAGLDLCADQDVSIAPGGTVMIGTGVAIAIPDNYFGAIFARSGLATKQGLRPANCVGVIDSDYRGEIIVALHNDSQFVRDISIGDRIAQLVIIPYLYVTFNEVPELDQTERGSGGFGSTGVSKAGGW